MKPKLVNRGCKCEDCVCSSRARKPEERRQFRRWIQRDTYREALLWLPRQSEETEP